MIILATIIATTLADLQVYPDMNAVFEDMYETPNLNLDEYTVYEATDVKPSTWKPVKDWQKAYEQFAVGLNADEFDEEDEEDAEIDPEVLDPAA